MKISRYILLLVVLAKPLPAHAFALQWPLDCTLGTDCFVQSYVDRDATPATQDFTCGPASYDAHDGTDIRLRHLAAMRSGVNVLAPADGVVMGVRDGVEDISVREAAPAAVKDRECGNGVRIQHTEGYVTQLCHMKKGSIRVQKGQQVKSGEALGQVGLSGKTEFPHLHIGVWEDGVALDPFDSQPMSETCRAGSASHAQGLWAQPIAYHPTALLGSGFADAVPENTTMRDTPENLASAATSIPALTYWTDIMNVRQGDQLALSITAPDGSIFAEKTQTLPKNMALYFSFIGKRNSAGVFTPGEYRSTLTLTRNGRTVIEKRQAILIR